jgi:glucokinase
MVGLGVGCAGTIDIAKGFVKNSPHIPFLRKYPLAKRLEKISGLNVTLANDVQAGVYGEHQFGAALGLKHVIGIFVGTGIGGAVIIDGKLMLGAHGHAGNIGHYSIHTVGLGGVNQDGLLNDLSSRTAISGEAAALALKQRAPNLLKVVGTDVAKIKSSDLATAIKMGDEKIEQMVRARARLIGIALSNIVDFLNPQMVVLGGGLTEAMPLLLRHEVQLGIKENATADAYRGLRVVAAKLKSHAVTTGAAKMALDAFSSAQ